MPTVVVFENGAEVDRVVGLQKTDELLSWLDGLARGETSLERIRRDASALPNDMHLRMQIYVWLWKNMLSMRIESGSCTTPS